MIRAAILSNPDRNPLWVDLVLDVGMAFYDETMTDDRVGYLGPYGFEGVESPFYLYRGDDRLLVKLGDGRTAVVNPNNLGRYMRQVGQSTDLPMALVDILDGTPIT